MKFENERLLIISPHPDDEILGCYGLINKVKKNGGKVFVQIMTIGGYTKLDSGKVKKAIWKKEFLKVVKTLKIDGYDIAFYNDNIVYLDTFPLKNLIDILESKSKVSLSKIKPTIVMIPTIFSTHQDHIQSYKAAISALRAHPQKQTSLPNMILSYESPEYYFWSAYSEFGKFTPNFYLQLSKDEIKNKVKALNIYKSQLRKEHRDGSRVMTLANIRGSEIGLDSAEAYHIHRLFTK